MKRRLREKKWKDYSLQKKMEDFKRGTLYWCQTGGEEKSRIRGIEIINTGDGEVI